MRFFKPMCKQFYILLILSFGALCSAQDVDFSVKLTPNRMYFDSIFSSDAKFFATERKNRILIYERRLHKRVGSICCHKGYISKMYFLKDGQGNDRLLQILSKEVDSLGEPYVASIYTVEGKRIYGPHKISSDSKAVVSVDREKTHFSVIGENKVSVYDTSLTEVKEHFFSKQLNDIQLVAISNRSSGIIVKHANSMIFVNLNSKRESVVESCDISGDRDMIIVPFDSVPNSFLVATSLGKLCIVRDGGAEEFKIDSILNRRPLAVYSAQDIIYIVMPEDIIALDMKSMDVKGVFRLKPYYESKFGKHSEVHPFFVQSEFNSDNSMFYLSSGGSTGVFFEIIATTK